ncbi:MAG: hypothetical protein D4R82_05910 [Dehalococcoidia bacterium]|nr:MAG: hypothetical protein D4R82_05910 [Dehalococcoidia bacterium]
MNPEVFEVFNGLSPSHQRLIREFISALAESEGVTIPDDHEPVPSTYQTYINPWCHHLIDTGCCPDTIRRYSLIVSSFLDVYPNPTSSDIHAALAHLSALGQNPDTIATTLNALTNFFAYLASQHIIPSNIAEPEDDI